MKDFLGIFEIPLIFEEPEPQSVYELRIRLKYKDTGLVETVHFQSVNVFKFIENDVEMIKWEHLKTLSEETEIVGEGTSLYTLEQYMINFNKKV